MACTLISFSVCVCVCVSKHSDACGRRVRSLMATPSPNVGDSIAGTCFHGLLSLCCYFIYNQLHSGLRIEEEHLAFLRQVQNGPQKRAPRNTLIEDWQQHIILLSYFFQLLMFFWPHYLLYTPFHLFYSHPLHLCSSLRLPMRYSVVLITLITFLTLLSFAVGGESA